MSRIVFVSNGKQYMIDITRQPLPVASSIIWDERTDGPLPGVPGNDYTIVSRSQDGKTLVLDPKKQSDKGSDESQRISLCNRIDSGDHLTANELTDYLRLMRKSGIGTA